MKLNEALENIEDPRIERCKKHKLSDILTICLLGFLCGLTDIENIAYWARQSLDTLRKIIPLENGVPSADTILRVLAIMDPKRFEEVLISVTKTYLDELTAKDIKEFVAIDGKTVRGSRTKSSKGIHIVSAWANKLNLFLGQVKTDVKSNEITAIPELLDLLDLKNTIITIDAMGCQKNIAKKIVEKKADYVLSLKGNQSTLQTDVEDFFKSMNEPNFVKRYAITKSELTVEKGHGRIEKRQTFLCCSLDWLKCRKDWANLNAIGMTIASRTIGDETTVERQYFISSLTDVEQCKKAFRNHWGIENTVLKSVNLMTA